LYKFTIVYFKYHSLCFFQIKPLKLYFTVAFKRLTLPCSTHPIFLLRPQLNNGSASVTKKQDRKCVSAATSLSRNQCRLVNPVIGSAREENSVSVKTCPTRKKELNHPETKANKNKPTGTGSVGGLNQSRRRGRPRGEYSDKLLAGLKNGHLQQDKGDRHTHGRRRGRPRKQKISVRHVSEQPDRMRQREDGSQSSDQNSTTSRSLVDEKDQSFSLNVTPYNVATSIDEDDVVTDDGEQPGSARDNGTPASSLQVVEPRSIWSILPSLCAESSLPRRQSADSSTVDDGSSINKCPPKSTRMTSSPSASSSSSVSSSSRRKSSSVFAPLPLKTEFQPNDAHVEEEALRNDALQLAPRRSSSYENKLHIQSTSVDVVYRSLTDLDDRKCRFKRDDNNNGDDIALGIGQPSNAPDVKDEPDSHSEVCSTRPRTMNLVDVSRASMCYLPQHAGSSPECSQYAAKLQLKSELLSCDALSASCAASTTVTTLASGRGAGGLPADEALYIKIEDDDVSRYNVSTAQLYQLTSGSSPTVSHVYKRDVIEATKAERRSHSSRPVMSIWRPIMSLVERSPSTPATFDEELTQSGTVSVEAARHRNLPPVVIATSGLPGCWRHNGCNIDRLG